MKPKLLLGLALVLSGFLAGCSTAKPIAAGDKDAEQIKLPVKFASYRELYTFIAKNSGGGLPTDDDTLFKLAADSRTKIITVNDEKLPYVYLVESHYFNGGLYDQIRGAQGNGSYFILRPLATNCAALDTDKGFDLVGIVNGNSCTFTNSNGKRQFVAHWHLSATESPESVYEWNGNVFEQVK